MTPQLLRSDLDVARPRGIDGHGWPQPAPGAPPPLLTVPWSAAIQRVHRTVIFTDIVASTELVVQLGDRRWSCILDIHDAVVRAEMRRCGADLVQSTGDGFLITHGDLDAAMVGVEHIIGAVGDLHLLLRTAVHQSQVEQRADTVSGLGVHVASRVLGLAAPGEILATAVCAEPLRTAGHEVTPRGAHALRGVPGEWDLYAVTRATS